MKKETIVIHSGGMDSSICLALAIREFGKENVLSLSYDLHQRHSIELAKSEKICKDWGVDHTVVHISCLKEITDNALINADIPIEHKEGEEPNTLIMGRNGLMARVGAIHADHIGANSIYMGVIEVEAWNSGYRDCSRQYMDLMQEIMRIDLANERFEIRTPIVKMTKVETLELAKELGVLEYLLENTITCYEGMEWEGCKACPACQLRNEGIKLYKEQYPEVLLPY